MIQCNPLVFLLETLTNSIAIRARNHRLSKSPAAELSLSPGVRFNLQSHSRYTGGPTGCVVVVVPRPSHLMHFEGLALDLPPVLPENWGSQT